MNCAAPQPRWWHSRRRFVADVLGYASERVIRLALTAIVGIVVARHLGPNGLGLLSFAGGVFSLLGPLALLGLPQILVREFSTQDDWRPILASALTVQLPVATAASAIGFLIVVLSRGFERDAVLLALVMLPLPLLAAEQFVRSYFEAVGQMGRIVVVGLTAGLIASVWKLCGVMADAPIWVFGAAGTVEAAVVCVGLLGWLPARRRIDGLRRNVRLEVAQRLLSESWPLLVAAIAVTIYVKADLLMLGVIAGDRETGIYSAAARLSEVWYFIPITAAAAARPRLARMYAAGDLDRYRASTQRFMTALSALALISVAGVMVAADQIIGVLYGSEFVGAAPVLRVHILAAPFVFLGVAGSQWFVDRGMTRTLMTRSIVGAVLNVALNLVLIPRYGAMGASIATLCAYAIAGCLVNAVTPSTRPLFALQARGLLLRWPR